MNSDYSNPFQWRTIPMNSNDSNSNGSNPFQRAALAAWVELSSSDARQWYTTTAIDLTMMAIGLVGKLLDRLNGDPAPGVDPSPKPAPPVPPAPPVEEQPPAQVIPAVLDTPLIDIVPTPGRRKRDRRAEEAGHVYDRFSSLPPHEFVQGFDSIEAAVDSTLAAFGESDPQVRADLIRYLQVKLN
jgi:hypothetical protein